MANKSLSPNTVNDARQARLEIEKGVKGVATTIQTRSLPLSLKRAVWRMRRGGANFTIESLCMVAASAGLRPVVSFEEIE